MCTLALVRMHVDCELRSVTQWGLTLCDPVDCSPPASSVHEDCPGKDPGVGCHAFLQGIFPIQGNQVSLIAGRFFISSVYQGSLYINYISIFQK